MAEDPGSDATGTDTESDATGTAPAEGETDLDTEAIHSGTGGEPPGALTTPIYANSTYEYDSPTERGGRYRYSRMAEPTRDDLETAIGTLESAAHASTFASGMAAIDAVLSLLSAGDHVVTGTSL